MKIAICYYSRHHGNTLKVIEAMTAGQEVDLIDVTVRVAVHLEQYDLIGFASGIYYNKYSDAVVSFARQYLPENKKVFFIYTYGAPKVTATIFLWKCSNKSAQGCGIISPESIFQGICYTAGAD